MITDVDEQLVAGCSPAMQRWFAEYIAQIDRLEVARYQAVQGVTLLIGLAVFHAQRESFEPMLINDTELRSHLEVSRGKFGRIVQSLVAANLIHRQSTSVEGCSTYRLCVPQASPPPRRKNRRQVFFAGGL